MNMISNIKLRIEVVKQIWPLLKDFKWHLVSILFVKLLLLVHSLLLPYIYKLFIDEVITRRVITKIYLVIVLYIGLFLLETVLRVVHRSVDNCLFNKVAYSLKSNLFKKYLYMEYSDFKSYSTSDLKNRLDSDVDMTKIFILEQVFSFITVLIEFVGASVILAFLNVKIAIFSMIMLPISIYISNRFHEKISERFEKLKQINNSSEQLLQDSIHRWKEIKSNNLNQGVVNQYRNNLMSALNESQIITDIRIKENFFVSIKDTWLNQMLIYIFGGILYLKDVITPGEVFSGVQYYNRIYASLKKLIDLDIQLEGLKPSINRVLEIMSINTCEYEYTKSSESQEPVVSFKNVFFQYNEVDIILRNIDITINRGERVLLCGDSGCGKTTLINLLLGYLKPTEGQVYVLNQNTSIVNQQFFLKNIAYIQQEPYIMNMSIREYLLMVCPNASFENLRNACEAVGVLEPIENLPRKFDTKVGERGECLSGGQLQRLSLARLYLTDKDIFVLDESLSAIDGEDRVKLLIRIMQQFREKTIIMISHDRELYSLFNRILTIQQGYIYDGKE